MSQQRNFQVCFFRLFEQQTMESSKKNNAYFLVIKSTTWNKDSHSLYDYESNKIQNVRFCFPLTSKPINVYRKRQGSSVIAYNNEDDHKIDPQQYQLLTTFNIKQTSPNHKIKIDFMNQHQAKTKMTTNQRLNTDQSISSCASKQQQAYLIVKNFKDNNGQDKGYPLQPGQTIKLGRVQYFISQMNCGGVIKTANPDKKNKCNNYNKNILKYNRQESLKSRKQEQLQCKICLQTEDSDENFLFNPCKCTGSCGTVHYQCLLQWIHFKVKKQVVGGTLHYNFQKFQCQVCKFELPMIIDIQKSQKQLLPLEKPKKNYMVLEAACEKSKSVMIIHNVPTNGIKLGRGHQCQIRITDISVSRTHALIKYINDAFVIFDNKSKFGTLIREQGMGLEMGKGSLGVQVGRTVLGFQIKKQRQSKYCELQQQRFLK